MKVILLFILGYMLGSAAVAQVTDNFSDGNFTVNPPWSGDAAKFNVSAGQLKLQAPAVAESAYLSTSSESINDAVWEFYLRMEFNPSSSNFAKIYLVSDNQNLSGPLNGYFVMAGNTADEISLYRQAGISQTKIIDGLDGRLNASIVSMKIKVTRSISGLWELFSDVGVTGTYLSEGLVADNTFDSSLFFGVHCTYTSTRSDKFFFDDILVTGNPFQDMTSPAIVSVVETINTITLTFNEELELLTSTDPQNYSSNNGLGNPSNAELLEPTKVLITYTQFFQNGVEYLLTVSDVRDLSGNAIVTIQVPFMYFQSKIPTAKDIIISEIFADPSPQIGLPDAEYIELYNRSSVPFDLNGWKVSDLTSTATFPILILLPGEYLIVTSSSSLSKFANLGKVQGLANFPTLNNDGDPLSLKSNSNEKIDSINYNLTWYRDEDKKQGGYSLEIIDPENVCGEESNWTASEDLAGGTPGQQNSVFAHKPDLTGPKLLSAIPTSSVQMLISFDEKLATDALSNATFIFTPSLSINASAFTDLSLRKIFLELSSDLVAGLTYQIKIESLFDCAGNVIQENFSDFTFGLPEIPLANDICINEILFNPRPSGADFVELYNNSQKFFNLKNWKLANDNNGTISNEKVITNLDAMFAPKSFIAVTPDVFNLKSNYPNSVENNLLQATLPSFPDDEGSVVLVSSGNQTIDQLFYSDDFHSALLKDKEGVSLERISCDEPTNLSQNWKSATSSAGFATPGFINSNAFNNLSPETGQVRIDPEVFNPYDASRSFSLISYEFEVSGLIANVKILDRQGRLIKTIINNESLSYNGFFRWDGDRDDGSKAGSGYYVVWFETFDLSGVVKTFRKRVVMAIQ